MLAVDGVVTQDGVDTELDGVVMALVLMELAGVVTLVLMALDTVVMELVGVVMELVGVVEDGVDTVATVATALVMEDIGDPYIATK